MEALEKEIECIVKTLFINPSEFDQGIILTDCNNEILIKEVNRVIKLAVSPHLIKSNIKYIKDKKQSPFYAIPSNLAS